MGPESIRKCLLVCGPRSLCEIRVRNAKSPRIPKDSVHSRPSKYHQRMLDSNMRNGYSADGLLAGMTFRAEMFTVRNQVSPMLGLCSMAILRCRFTNDDSSRSHYVQGILPVVEADPRSCFRLVDRRCYGTPYTKG